jgi:hypothetical protein
VSIFVAIWVGLLSATMALRMDRHFFIATQAILDVILVSAAYVGFAQLR